MRVLVPAFEPDLVIVMPGGYDMQAAVEEKLLPIDLGDSCHFSRFVDVSQDWQIEVALNLGEYFECFIITDPGERPGRKTVGLSI